MGAQSQTQQVQQIDKRTILAVIKAVAKINSLTTVSSRQVTISLRSTVRGILKTRVNKAQLR